mgnify:CR=1 FL=1
MVFTAVDVVRVELLGRDVDDDGRTDELVEFVERLLDVDDGRTEVVREVDVVVLGVTVDVREVVVVVLRAVVEAVGRAGNVLDLRVSEEADVVVAV